MVEDLEVAGASQSSAKVIGFTSAANKIPLTDQDGEQRGVQNYTDTTCGLSVATNLDYIITSMH